MEEPVDGTEIEEDRQREDGDYGTLEECGGDTFVPRRYKTLVAEIVASRRVETFGSVDGRLSVGVMCR